MKKFKPKFKKGEIVYCDTHPPFRFKVIGLCSSLDGSTFNYVLSCDGSERPEDVLLVWEANILSHADYIAREMRFTAQERIYEGCGLLPFVRAFDRTGEGTGAHLYVSGIDDLRKLRDVLMNSPLLKDPRYGQHG